MTTLLVLNINPRLEEELVDYLLSLEFVSGFSAYRVEGHGKHPDMSVAEQVTGRRRRLQVELMLLPEQSQLLLEGLAEQVGHDIVWWEQPVSRSGRIS